MTFLPPLGPDFLVNGYTPDAQDSARLAALPDGGFVVVWESFGPTGFGN